jgi:hypothetical protein
MSVSLMGMLDQCYAEKKDLVIFNWAQQSLIIFRSKDHIYRMCPPGARHGQEQVEVYYDADSPSEPGNIDIIYEQGGTRFLCSSAVLHEGWFRVTEENYSYLPKWAQTELI